MIPTQGMGNSGIYDPHAFGMDNINNLSYDVEENHDIVFTEGNIKWNYIGFSVLDYFQAAANASRGLRSKEDADAWIATYQP